MDHRPISENTNYKSNTLQSEYLINKIHFIWLGSNLNEYRAKNIPMWIVANKNCNFDFIIWYDSALISKFEEKETINYVGTLDHSSIQLRDIRNYGIMDIAINDNFIKVIEAYNYESGIWPRAKINPIAQKISNWGFASDVLRMLILHLYGGFYVDTDMEPIRLCDYFADKKIKSCPLRFCMAGELKSSEMMADYDNGEKMYIDAVNNNALYYDNMFDPDFRRIKKYFEIVARRYEWLKNDYYHYLLFNFVRATVNSSGSDAIIKSINMSTDYSKGILISNEPTDYILRLFREDSSIANMSWNVKTWQYDTISILLSDLFNDKDSLIRCYYKISFGSAYFNLTLHESIWLTKILDSIIEFNINRNYSSDRVIFIERLTRKQIKQNYPDIKMYLSDQMMDNLIKTAIFLRMTYNISDVYPNPEHLLLTILRQIFILYFWGGMIKFVVDPVIKVIMELLKYLGNKIYTPENINPKFFEKLLLEVSCVSLIHWDDYLAAETKEIKYNTHYESIQNLIDMYK